MTEHRKRSKKTQTTTKEELERTSVNCGGVLIFMTIVQFILVHHSLALFCDRARTWDERGTNRGEIGRKNDGRPKANNSQVGKFV